MYRYTTPTHTFKFTTNPADMSEILITYSQRGNILVEKRKADLTFDSAENTASFAFTQQETALFTEGTFAKVQVRVLMPDGMSFASEEKEFQVLPVLHETILEATDA